MILRQMIVMFNLDRCGANIQIHITGLDTELKKYPMPDVCHLWHFGIIEMKTGYFVFLQKFVATFVWGSSRDLCHF